MGTSAGGCLPGWPAHDGGAPSDMGAPDMPPAPRVGFPGGTMTDPSNSISVDALVPTYSATTIAGLTLQTESLPMPMDHLSLQVSSAAFGACTNCHSNLGAGGSYYPGVLHSSLANLQVAEPTACSDCHATSMPTGFVGPTATTPARTPSSGEMKHDAVEWVNDAPTSTKIVPAECGTCHASPSQSLNASWATGVDGTTPVKFHPSLTAAGLPQPASCVDCHANTRPNAVLTSANSALPAVLQFDHTAANALTDCASCHTKTDAWPGGKFHLPGSATPTTCLSCHQGERPTSTAGWTSTSYTSVPFDYVTNSHGITHGDGLDCVTCHNGPGSGTWGVNQNWTGGKFVHGVKTASGTTCIACHTTQRPDLQPGTSAAAMATLLGFDHSINGTGDCFGCHQSTVGVGSYVNYDNPGSGTLPGGDWKGGVSYPGSTLISGSDQFVTVTEIALNRSGALNLVTSTTSSAATLYNSMLHVSSVLPPQLSAGPTGMPDTTKCWHCHTNNNGIVTAYANGQYHSSLTNFTATPGGAVTPFPQPTSNCADCHSPMRPTNIVEKGASELQPMDHNALFTTTVTIGGTAVNGVSGIECSVCHHSPGVSWTDGLFHAEHRRRRPRGLHHLPLPAHGRQDQVGSDQRRELHDDPRLDAAHVAELPDLPHGRALQGGHDPGLDAVATGGAPPERRRPADRVRRLPHDLGTAAERVHAEQLDVHARRGRHRHQRRTVDEPRLIAARRPRLRLLPRLRCHDHGQRVEQGRSLPHGGPEPDHLPAVPRPHQRWRRGGGHQEQPAAGAHQLVDADQRQRRLHHRRAGGHARSDHPHRRQRLGPRLQLLPHADRHLEQRRHQRQGVGAGEVPRAASAPPTRWC